MSKIEWTDETWNPITGCSKISPGCQNCYAERMSKRLAGRYGYPKDDPFKVTFHPDKLEQPLKWKKPRRIFVCSMGDLFHEKVMGCLKPSLCNPESFLDKMFLITRRCWQHTFLILTKRPENMLSFYHSFYAKHPGYWSRNIWLGITAENQQQYDARWEIASQIPITNLFVSGEPLLGPIDFSKHERKPDWFIVGGESGTRARPMHPDYARSLRDQCLIFRVPFFFKQWGEWLPFDQRVAGQISDSERLKQNEWAWKTGKKTAGRRLDYRTWDQFPK